MRDLTVAFSDRTVLADLDLVVPPGRRIAVVGENGVGTTTLLLAAADRLPPLARREGAVEARGPRDNERFVHAFKGARVESTLARRKRQAEPGCTRRSELRSPSRRRC